MKNKVSVTNIGIESSGLTADYMEAITEYIWNGFDASAKNISIEFETNSIGTINDIKIVDDGKGIDFSMLDQTFGNFNDSIKKHSYQKSSSTLRGNKGKGRFSFTAFSGQAKWQTIYEEENDKKLLSYDIIIRRNAKEFYEPDNRRVSNEIKTGTIVTLTELFEVTGNSFQCDEFKNYLAQEFGWFLLLNKEQSYSIKINNEELNYQHLIAENEISILPIKDVDGKENYFKITYVRWNEKIGDKFYFYYLNSKQNEIFKELTSYNNNAIGFNHSVYVESRYFDSFSPSDSGENRNLFEETKGTGVFKALDSHLKSILKAKQRLFIYGEAAEKLITGYEKTGVIPKFRNNKYEQARKKDLVDVVKGIYCIEPKIFQGLNKEQQKVSVGLINLLLDTEERESIIEIIGQIVILSSDDRLELSQLLKKTTVSRISKTINLIEARFKVVELLKLLVFDLAKFTNERDHVQKAIEENYWLFGEQYHIVSANEGFDILLNRYIEFVEGLEEEDKKNKKKVESEESNRRPDIFVCKKHSVPDIQDSQYLLEENLIVELKRPTVIIGKEQLRQIEDYLDIIRDEPQFNSQKRFWKFFIVGNKIDNHVKDQYESEKVKGKKFLVKGIQNFEIYAFTWDDIFMMFDLRHKFLIDNLDFDRNVLRAELIEKGIDIFGGTQSSAFITKELIDLSKVIL